MLRRLLQTKNIRLVTILGPNGIGKTSLSLQIAHRLLSWFKDAQDPLWEAILCVNIGQAALDQDDQARARQLFLEGLVRCWQLADP